MKNCSLFQFLSLLPLLFFLGGASSVLAEKSDSELVRLEEVIQRLELRSEKLKAADEVENLQRTFGYYFDQKNWEKVASLFSDNGSFESAQRGVYFGRERIQEMLKKAYGGPGLGRQELFNHMQVQPIISVSEDGTTAKARLRAINQIGRKNEASYWQGGVYENEFIKTNGKWYIDKLHFYDTYNANYKGGWAQNYLPIDGALEMFPPDDSPTEVFGTFPDVHLPPFHFEGSGQQISDFSVDVFNTKNSNAGLSNRLHGLADQLTVMEDEAAIENLQRAYGYYVDKGLWQQAVELFAEDGTLEIGGRGIFSGRDRVLQYYRYLGHEGPQRGALVNHIQLQPVVNVSDGGYTANGRFTFLAQIGVVSSDELDQVSEENINSGEQLTQSQELFRTGLWGIGTYENEFQKVDGVWHIKKLYGVFRMYTFYGPGWAKHAEKNTRPEGTLPPDFPPTVTYDMYPQVYFQPFHYNHPVTGDSHEERP